MNPEHVTPSASTRAPRRECTASARVHGVAAREARARRLLHESERLHERTL
jgi:DNA-dependent RNA polymerase auxiliary subunit epsilon